MGAAPPQGFGIDPEIIRRMELVSSTIAAQDTSLNELNNFLLNTLVRHMELITDEENVNGDDDLGGNPI